MLEPALPRPSIDGVEAALLESEGCPCLVVRAASPLDALSSAVVGGGFRTLQAIVNRQVTKDYMADDPEAEMRGFVDRLGLAGDDEFVEARGASGADARLRSGGDADRCGDARWRGAAEAGGGSEGESSLDDALARLEPASAGGSRIGVLDEAGVAGLLTAAFVREVGFAECAIGDTGRVAAAWATAGLGNAARAGRERAPAGGLFPGTINVIVVVDGDLAAAAFVGAVTVAAEAKAAALLALGVRDPDDGGVATGTTTDAVVIAATRRGETARYAGAATYVGHAIGRSVYDAVYDSGRRYLAYVAARAAQSERSAAEPLAGTGRDSGTDEA
ncbi:adenosylcobinamide amidohydrolase [Paenibacillus sp. TRM 82003]|nr:adenosylcobinamide amidohydrolase [Paenibacillus sp. TRM 82003]